MNLLFLKRFYDINFILVEVTVNNCQDEPVIDNFTVIKSDPSSSNQLNDYLKFRCNFQKLFNSSLSIQLSLNRRLGDGCSNKLSFYSKKWNDLDDDDDDFGLDIIWLQIKEIFGSLWRSVSVSATCLFGFVVSVIFLVNLVVLLVLFWLRRRRIEKSKKVLEINSSGNSSIRLRNLRKKMSENAEPNQSLLYSDVLGNSGGGGESSRRMSKQKKDSIRLKCSLDEFKQMKHLIVDGNNGSDYEKIHFDKNNLQKNLIFQQNS